MTDGLTAAGGQGWVMGVALALALTAPAAADDQLPIEPRFGIGAGTSEWPTRFTLFDPSMTLPELDTDDLLRLDWADDEPLLWSRSRTSGMRRSGAARLGVVSWQLRYLHSPLSPTSSSALLRADPSTGFSTHADRDVLDFGVSWHLGRDDIGLDYQLHSARSGTSGGAGGFSRFLPGSSQTTHAFTLGMTHRFGAGPAPQPAPPLLLLPPETPLVHRSAPPPQRDDRGRVAQ